jgi:hypothetical protein
MCVIWPPDLIIKIYLGKLDVSSSGEGEREENEADGKEARKARERKKQLPFFLAPHAHAHMREKLPLCPDRAVPPSKL